MPHSRFPISRLEFEQNIHLYAVFTTQPVELSEPREAFALLIKCVHADPMCYSSSLNSVHKAPSIWISSPAKPDHPIWTKHPGAAYGHSCFPMIWAKRAFVFILRMPHERRGSLSLPMFDLAVLLFSSCTFCTDLCVLVCFTTLITF